MHLVECTPAGTVFRVDADIVKSCQPAIHLRIGLEDQAAFWALAYLSVKSSSTVARPTAVSFSIDDQRHITSMLEFFRGDDGSEFCAGDGGANSDDGNAPPGYTELVSLSLDSTKHKMRGCAWIHSCGMASAGGVDPNCLRSIGGRGQVEDLIRRGTAHTHIPARPRRACVGLVSVMAGYLRG
ncbi:hypothetical protein C8R43DRAFT_1132425 [Mycena crocata]|nr:hypothetical protein C8R43DRAFT_1132425 [Mycena crocata]